MHETPWIQAASSQQGAMCTNVFNLHHLQGCSTADALIPIKLNLCLRHAAVVIKFRPVADGHITSQRYGCAGTQALVNGCCCCCAYSPAHHIAHQAHPTNGKESITRGHQPAQNTVRAAEDSRSCMQPDDAAQGCSKLTPDGLSYSLQSSGSCCGCVPFQ